MFRIYKPLQGLSTEPGLRAALTLALAFGGLAGPGAARGDEVRPRSANTFQTVTGDDPEEDRHRWDNVYNTKAYVFGKEPAAILSESIRQLPKGRALDIAMGEGRNAVYLARQGWSVDGVDLSEVALRKARRLAHEQGVRINAVNADLNAYVIKPDTYDVIVDVDYLQRNLISAIKRGLRKGGVVVFENATVEQIANQKGRGLRRDLLLEKGELRQLFKDLQILVYREDNDGKNARARLVARKP